MDVGFLFCQDCFFSQRAHVQLVKALESMVGPDREKLNLNLQSFDIKEIENHSKATQLHRTKVHIVIVSQHFLDRLRHEANVKKKTSPIQKILKPKRVIGILLSVTLEEIVDGFQEYLPQFSDWHSIKLKSSNKLDSEFYKNFSEHMIKIYLLEQSSTLTFSLFPKKITKDQTKVAVLFKTAVEPSDKVQVNLTRGRQREYISEVMMTNPLSGIVRVPASLLKDGSSLIEMTVCVNDLTLGTKQVKFEHNFKTVENDIIEKMSLLLPGFRKLLDDHVCQHLSKCFRACEDFSHDESLELMNDTLNSKSEDLPTPLHFAAYHGLEQTVCVLLYESDGLKMAMTKNEVGETATDLAMERGFSTIGQTIKDFYEMTNTFGALKYIKDLCIRHSVELELLDQGQLPVSRDESDYQNQNAEKSILQVDNPEYMDMQPVTIHVESVTDDEPSTIGNENDVATNISTLSQHHSIQHAYQNFDAEAGHVTNNDAATKNAILQTYDVPPPPVVIKKPPRKKGTVPQPHTLTPKPNEYDVVKVNAGYYVIPPMTRPVAPAKPSRVPTSPILSVKTKNALITTDDGYMIADLATELASRKISKSEVKPEQVTKPSDHEPKYPPVLPIELRGFSKAGFLKNDKSPFPLTKQFSMDSTQEELLELMNAFKNNVYNLRELELLYENWKQRNDVQLDFKVRQKELREIQKEYRKIQEKVRRETKKSGPVAKLLKLIPGASRKKTSVTGIVDPNLKQSSAVLLEEVSLPPVAAEDSDRKVSDTSTSDRSTLSDVSALDGCMSDPESEKERLRQLRCRFDVDSYVPPSQLEPTSVPPEPPVRPLRKPSADPMPHAPHHVENTSVPPEPPARPLKKPSVDNTTLSPSIRPVPRPYSNIEENSEVGRTEPVTSNDNEGTVDPVGRASNGPPPLPPARPMKSDSPFSYIDYEGKAKGLPKP